MPIVTLNDEFRQGGHASVDIDFDPGMSSILEHLRSTGRHHVVMVDEPDNGEPSPRAQSYLRQSVAIGLEPRIFSAMVEGLAHMQIGTTAADQLLQEGSLPDAVICFNDAVAIGVLKHFQLAGIEVPRDCGIVGIDGLAIGTLVTPELTTLSLDISEVAASAVDMVLSMLQGHRSTNGRDLRRTLSHSLVLRNSA
jgi:LacI family transcriptional regulator